VNIFYLHVGLMLSAALCLLMGMAVAMTLRRKRWWLKAHRFIGIAGVAIMAAGFTAAIMLVSLSGRSHFGPPHTWLGGMTLSGAALTPTLGFSIFKFPKRAIVLRRIHRWLGRWTITMVMVTIVSGLLLVGIL
jgi:hypothetical protein